MTGQKVLIVDDEEVFARNICRMLAVRGYLASAVNSGDAIRSLAERPAAVIVLDLKMPGMGGLNTMKEIRKLGFEAPTVILTGHGSIDSALEAVKQGAM